MLDTSFDYIWKEIIYKSACSIFDTISEDDRQRFNLVLRDEQTMKQKVFCCYEESRNILKKYYYDNGASGLIDEHKIAACLCKSLVANKIVSYKLSKELPEPIFFANYKIAYVASVGIIYLYLLNYFFNKDTEAFDILKRKQNLFLPLTQDGHDEYDICIIKMLTMNDLYGNHFDILAYAFILFSLEEYNKTFLLRNTEISEM